MKIGLTGGIASGKSTVSAMFKKRGALIIDADQIAREVVMPGSLTLAKIVEKFGQAVLAADGTLERKKLGQIVFSDQALRKQLESIIHPAIRKAMLAQIQEAMDRFAHRLIVVDIPLLFESKLQAMFPKVVVVYVPAQIQLQRLITRDGLNETEAKNRLRSQMSIEDKREKADYIIDNSGSLSLTEQQVEAFIQTMQVELGKELQ